MMNAIELVRDLLVIAQAVITAIDEGDDERVTEIMPAELLTTIARHAARIRADAKFKS